QGLFSSFIIVAPKVFHQLVLRKQSTGLSNHKREQIKRLTRQRAKLHTTQQPAIGHVKREDSELVLFFWWWYLHAKRTLRIQRTKALCKVLLCHASANQHDNTCGIRRLILL